MDEKRTIKNWAARLSMTDEPLTLEEARTLASISCADRLLECLGALQDIQMRLTRLELFVATRNPGYDHIARRALLDGSEVARANGA